MSEIRAITPQKPVNSDAVEKLEALLEQVKSGDVESFIAAAFRPNKRWFTTYSGQIDTLAKLGALDCMKADLRKTMDLSEDR